MTAFALLALIVVVLISGLILGNAQSPLTLSLGWMVLKYGTSISVFLLVLFFALGKSRRQSHANISAPSLPETPMFDETLLTTMFHTAQLSGDISQNTLQTLLRSYKHLTGKTVSQGMITAKYAQRTQTADLLSIMAPFTRIERDTMMKGCIDVAVADDAISTPEHDFLLDLNNALGLDGVLFRDQIRAVLRPETAPAFNAAAQPA
jgi:hypothetical protein